MEKDQAVALLRQKYAEETVNAYVTEAETRVGPQYWATLPNEETLLYDMDLFIQALALRGKASDG